MTDPNPDPSLEHDAIAALRAEILAIQEPDDSDAPPLAIEEVHSALGTSLAPDPRALAAVEQLMETPPADLDLDGEDSQTFRFHLMDCVDEMLRDRRLLAGRIEPILHFTRMREHLTFDKIAEEINPHLDIDVTVELLSSLEDGTQELSPRFDDVLAEWAVVLELEEQTALPAMLSAFEANAANERAFETDVEAAYAGGASHRGGDELTDRVAHIAARMKEARQRRE